MAVSPFELSIAKRETSELGDPPCDPLDELPGHVRNIARFCFEENHWVRLRVGGVTKMLSLWTDIERSFDGLRNAPERLERGEPASIVFAEMGLTLELAPVARDVRIRLHQWGNTIDTFACTVRLAVATSTLTAFTNDLLARAVAGGYLTAAQRDELA